MSNSSVVKAAWLSMVLWCQAAGLVMAAPSPLLLAGHGNNRLLVEAQWLNQQLENETLQVVDVRPATAYLAGHIPGAVNIPMKKTFSPVPPLNHVGPVTYIQKLFGDAGISQDTTVVLYDDGEFADAGRVFWVFEVYGHRHIAVLNGGFVNWSQRGFSVSQDVPVPAPKKYVGLIQPERLATKLHTRLAVDDGNKIIIDARSVDEYAGKKSKASRFGHIANAVNVPWDRNLQQRNGVPLLRDRRELESLYEDFPRDKSIITYCNSGRRSSFTYFVLRYLGRDVSHYDGSWKEWGNDVKLPIEK
jgi:thiosulfate/3-mercaptopyruvate sulfurtransferase